MSTTAEKIKQFIVLRDHKEKADKEFKKSMERVNQALEKLEAELITDLDTAGLSTSRADGVGTAYIRVVTNMKTTDADALLQWATDNDEFGALDIKPNKTIVRAKFEAGVIVPGVEMTSTRLIGVRQEAPKAKKGAK